MTRTTAQQIADVLTALEAAEARARSPYDAQAAAYWREVAAETAKRLEAIPEVNLSQERKP